jgi:NAD(P)-dependent dehydrogenase (short-subunit alcohol dehydrogenase family)
MLRVNLRSVPAQDHVVGQHMRAHGHGGSVINVVTIEASRAAPNYAVYAAAKTAVVSFTRTMALELAHRIRVNAIAPDICSTEGLAAVVPARGPLQGHRAPRASGRESTTWRGSRVPGLGPRRLRDRRAAPVDGRTAAAGGWYHADSGWISAQRSPG